jgi:hypothetical protein
MLTSTSAFTATNVSAAGQVDLLVECVHLMQEFQCLNQVSSAHIHDVMHVFIYLILEKTNLFNVNGQLSCYTSSYL